MGITIQKTAVGFTGRKKAIVLGLFIWIIALILSMVIMSLLGIHPENTSEHWGINHPKYLQFELLMIPTMVVLMFGMAYVYYAEVSIQTVSRMDVLADGILIMAIQFILDFLVLVILFGNGVNYFYGLVTVSYLTIPIQWYIFAKILSTYKH